MWDRNEALIEIVLVVLGTDHFVERHFLLTLVAPVPLNGVPRHRECTGVLNVNFDFQPFAAVDDFESMLARFARSRAMRLSRS
jgi:hypothetical protein